MSVKKLLLPKKKQQQQHFISFSSSTHHLKMKMIKKPIFKFIPNRFDLISFFSLIEFLSFLLLLLLFHNDNPWSFFCFADWFIHNGDCLFVCSGTGYHGKMMIDSEQVSEPNHIHLFLHIIFFLLILVISNLIILSGFFF